VKEDGRHCGSSPSPKTSALNSDLELLRRRFNFFCCVWLPHELPGIRRYGCRRNRHLVISPGQHLELAGGNYQCYLLLLLVFPGAIVPGYVLTGIFLCY
jgi:hypothetical protein